MIEAKIIGLGNTAEVYPWEDGKVLKLFYKGYPKEAVEREYSNAKVIEALDFTKPKAYELISYKDQIGIIYDRVEGESLLQWVLKTNNVEDCAEHMARLHQSILNNRVRNVQCYKDFLKYHIEIAERVSLNEREKTLELLDKLPDGDTLCHGDFHPGNILMSGVPTVIDFMNICHGDYLYDVARTVFLIEYTPVPGDFSDREKLLCLKRYLAALYLEKMKVTRDMIGDYLSVISIARAGECPDE